MHVTACSCTRFGSGSSDDDLFECSLTFENDDDDDDDGGEQSSVRRQEEPELYMSSFPHLVVVDNKEHAAGGGGFGGKWSSVRIYNGIHSDHVMTTKEHLLPPTLSAVTHSLQALECHYLNCVHKQHHGARTIVVNLFGLKEDMDHVGDWKRLFRFRFPASEQDRTIFVMDTRTVKRMNALYFPRTHGSTSEWDAVQKIYESEDPWTNFLLSHVEEEDVYGPFVQWLLHRLQTSDKRRLFLLNSAGTDTSATLYRRALFGPPPEAVHGGRRQDEFVFVGLRVEAAKGKGVRATSCGALLVNASEKKVQCNVLLSVKDESDHARIEIIGSNTMFRAQYGLSKHSAITRWFVRIFVFKRAEKDAHEALTLLLDAERIMGEESVPSFLSDVIYELVGELPVSLKGSLLVEKSASRNMLTRSTSISL